MLHTLRTDEVASCMRAMGLTIPGFVHHPKTYLRILEQSFSDAVVSMRA
jgi:hypothetical protein